MILNKKLIQTGSQSAYSLLGLAHHSLEKPKIWQEKKKNRQPFRQPSKVSQLVHPPHFFGCALTSSRLTSTTPLPAFLPPNEPNHHACDASPILNVPINRALFGRLTPYQPALLHCIQNTMRLQYEAAAGLCKGNSKREKSSGRLSEPAPATIQPHLL